MSCHRSPERWRDGVDTMSRKNAIKVIGIAGGSGSGKSWLAERLTGSLGSGAVAVSLDSFYRHRPYLSIAQRARVNYDHPRAIDWAELISAVRQVKRGKNVGIPNYDYSQHARVGDPVTLDVGGILIVEGLWTLRRRELRPLLDLAIYVDASYEWRLEKRLARDVAERGRSKASVVRQFREHVEPMHQRFVEPQRARADVILESPISEEAIRVVSHRVARLIPTTSPDQR